MVSIEPIAVVAFLSGYAVSWLVQEFVTRRRSRRYLEVVDRVHKTGKPEVFRNCLVARQSDKVVTIDQIPKGESHR